MTTQADTIDRQRDRERPTHYPGYRARRGAFGWYLDFQDPFGASRPMTPPLDDEDAVHAAAEALRLPAAQRRERV